MFKRIIVFLLCMAFLLNIGLILSVAETPTAVIAYGDIDLDGNVNAKDALMILRYVVGKDRWDAQTVIRGDVSSLFHPTQQHKGVDTKDAMIVLHLTVHGYPPVRLDNLPNG